MEPRVNAAERLAEPHIEESVMLEDLVMRHPHNPIAWLQAVRAKVAEGRRVRAGILARLASPACANRAALQHTLAVVNRDVDIGLPAIEAFVRCVLEAQEADIHAAGPGRSIGAQVLRDPDDTAAQLRAARGALLAIADVGLAPCPPADQALRVASIEGQVELLEVIDHAKRLRAKRALTEPAAEA